MNPNAFIGLAQAPSEEELAAALGKAKALWDRLLDELAADFTLTEWEWHSYSRKAGWSVRVKQNKRNILYLIPCAGLFRVAFVLGEKALQQARESKLPAAVLETLASARKYAEGTAVDLNVKSASHLPAIKKLTAAKLAH